ncbi:hypothetical protein [Streptomyces sp. MnatMP-M17]|uniref:hypothetical protein n=1 Tax=unclassified Streptomyces TaxID=2593676 RepID=UPI00081D4923|nr:hypothetical protein [Streptomyces sp. MnatMP-M17]MYZ39652.1 hypothetical protein [Streptomyces sp. SID4917]SCG04690.1 hypothetical protein GA0115259_109093 [Streptomyces sp. MnatMP-M17]
MGFTDEVWRVVAREDGRTVGHITIEVADFPWLSGRFTPGPAFESVRPLFDHELALLDRIDEDQAAWEASYDAVERAVSLHSPTGPVAEFLLHIKGDRAWFRWSDTPFPED